MIAERRAPIDRASPNDLLELVSDRSGTPMQVAAVLTFDRPVNIAAARRVLDERVAAVPPAPVPATDPGRSRSAGVGRRPDVRHRPSRLRPSLPAAGRREHRPGGRRSGRSAASAADSTAVVDHPRRWARRWTQRRAPRGAPCAHRRDRGARPAGPNSSTAQCPGPWCASQHLRQPGSGCSPTPPRRGCGPSARLPQVCAWFATPGRSSASVDACAHHDPP